MSMATHECCCLITISDGKTAEGDTWTQPHVGMETEAFFFFLRKKRKRKKTTLNVCARMYMGVINWNCCILPGLHIKCKWVCDSFQYKGWSIEQSLKGLTVPDAETKSGIQCSFDWHVLTGCCSVMINWAKDTYFLKKSVEKQLLNSYDLGRIKVIFFLGVAVLSDHGIGGCTSAPYNNQRRGNQMLILLNKDISPAFTLK